MRALALLLAALALPAAAEQPDASGQTGFVLGARVGWGVPFGKLSGDVVDVREVVDEKIPIWLELGYRFTRHFRGELLFELAPASVEPDYCSPDVSCSATDVRLGLALQYHLAPEALLDPWAGVGFGVEVLNAQLSDAEPLGPPGRREFTWAGVEMAFVEAGLDVALSRWFSLGPYVSASFARFTSLTQRPSGGSSTRGSIDDRETHGWLQFGLKTAFEL